MGNKNSHGNDCAVVCLCNLNHKNVQKEIVYHKRENQHNLKAWNRDSDDNATCASFTSFSLLFFFLPLSFCDHIQMYIDI